MTGPISATCCPCPLTSFYLPRVPKGAVLSKQDEVFRKRPIVNLWVNFSFAMKLQTWPLGKKTVLNTVPRSVVSSEESQCSTVEFWSWQDLPLESFSFFICVTLIQLTSFNLSIPTCKMELLIVLSHTVVKGLQEMIFGISPGTQFPYMLVIVILKYVYASSSFALISSTRL